MKALKIILYIIIALLILLITTGLLNPSVSYGHEIEVDKPLKEAWAVSQDHTKFDQWLHGFKSIELISGEQDAVGSKYKVIINPGEGQEDFEMIETLTAREEFDHVKLDFESEMMNFVHTISFTGDDTKATVKTESKVMAKGIMSRSMFALMEMLASSFTKQEVKNLEALKKVIEENTTDYYPEPVEMPQDTLTQEETMR